MVDDRPDVAVGHVRLHTGDMTACREFYQLLGMRECMAWDGMSILELRGGTHLLLIETDDEMQQVLDPVFDLMVDDIETYKERLDAAGCETSALTFHAIINHHRFSVLDPDGRRVTVHSDHTEGRRV